MTRKKGLPPTDTYLYDALGNLWYVYADRCEAVSAWAPGDPQEDARLYTLQAERASVDPDARRHQYDWGRVATGLVDRITLTCARAPEPYGPAYALRNAYAQHVALAPTISVHTNSSEGRKVGLYEQQYTWQRVAVRWNFLVAHGRWRDVSLVLASRRFAAPLAAVTTAATSTVRALCVASAAEPVWPRDAGFPTRRAVWAAAAQSLFAEHLRREQTAGALAGQLAELAG